MKVELDGILLNDTQAQADGGILEGRSISSVNATDGRNMVMISVPGMEGSVFQDLGRTAVKISFEGVISGRSALSVVEMIRSKFKQGTPLAFNSDVSGAADVTKVIIEDFKVIDAAGTRGRYGYSLLLKEYMEPPPQPSPPPSQDAAAEEWAENAAEEAEESVNVVAGKVLDAGGAPKGGVTVKVTGPDSEYTLTTGDDGIYRTESLPPGEYEITVGSEGYENLKHKVVIGEGGATPTEGESEEPRAEPQGEGAAQVGSSEPQAEGTRSQSEPRGESRSSRGEPEVKSEGPVEASRDIPPPGEKAEEPEAEPVKAAPEKPKKKSGRTKKK
jgi:hypothetical protein